MDGVVTRKRSAYPRSTFSVEHETGMRRNPPGLCVPGQMPCRVGKDWWLAPSHISACHGSQLPATPKCRTIAANVGSSAIPCGSGKGLYD